MRYIKYEPLNEALSFYGAPAVSAGGIPQWVRAFSIRVDGVTTFAKAPELGLAKAWTALSAYSGNWNVNPDSSTFYALEYSKAATNKVRLRGAVKNVSGSTLSAGIYIATLPSDCCPTRRMLFIVPFIGAYSTWHDNYNTAGTCAICVCPDGNILISNNISPDCTLWLDDIEFYVA